MIIRLNDQPLDFTIEKEKNLGDVLASLEGWVGDNGCIVQRVVVDRMDVPLADDQGDLQREISSIGEIEVFATTKERHAAETLSTLGEYIHIVLEKWIKPDPASSSAEEKSTYGEIMKGLETIVEAANSSSAVLGIRGRFVQAGLKRSLVDIVRDLEGLKTRYEKRYFESVGREAILSALEELLELLPRILKWAVVKNPAVFDEVDHGRKARYFKEALADFQAVLSDEEQVFEEIGRNLQIGNDPKALDDIYRVTEILDEYIALLKLAEGYGVNLGNLKTGGISVEEIFRDISARLTEAHKGLDLGDMITVGDVMEYEIRPLWERLSGLLLSIQGCIPLG
jgi:hypothetical protein